MILPSHERCQQLVKDLLDEPTLTEWEHEFLSSNTTRIHFTDKQREVFAKLEDKYEI